MQGKRVSNLLIGFFVSVTFLLTFVNIANAEKRIVWKAQCAFSTGLPYYKHASYFADKVKEMSNGRLIIEMNAGGSIVPVFSEQEAVHRGAIDLTCTTPNYIRGKFPECVLIGSSMFLFKEQEFMAWLEYGGGYDFWQEMYDRKNYKVKVLPAYCYYGGETLGWYRKPVRDLEDFNGIKYRTCGEWGEVVERLGGSVVTIPGGELYTALERGTLDAVEMSHPSLDRGLGLYEICKYNLYPGIHQYSGPMETLVNPKKWAELPEDLKAIVKAALHSSTVRSITKTIIEDAEAVEFFKTKGVEIIKLSPEVLDKLRKITFEVLDEHAAKDPFYNKILQSKRNFHAKWQKYMEVRSIN